MRLGKLPIQKMIDHGIDVIRSAVLIIQIVRVLPDVDGQKGRLAMGHRRIGVGRLDNLETLFIGHQPGPPASKLTHGRSAEFPLKIVITSKALIDSLADLPLRLSSPARRQAFPIEVVIPCLSGVIEESRLVGKRCCFLYDLNQMQISKLGAPHQLSRLVHVRFMMLAVMETDRVFLNVGLESIFLEGQLGESECAR